MAGGSSTIIRRAIRVSAGFALALVAGCADDTPTGIALVGATLIDGSGGAPRPNAVVVVRNGKIESVSDRSEFTLPKRTVEIDVTGKWLVPGFIDAHAHVTPWAMSRYLAFGVTALRDVHGTLDTILALRRRVSAGDVVGPRIYAAGAMIDGRPGTYADAIAVDGTSEARRAVDRLAVAGVDFINVYTRIDPTMLRAVIDEANTFGMQVTAHLGLTDAITAARMGVRSIERLTGIPEAASRDASPYYSAHYQGFWPGWTVFERGWAGLDSAALARVAAELAERKVILIPTLVLHETFSRLDDTTVTHDAAFRLVPAATRERWDVPGMVAQARWKPADFAAFRRSRAAQDRFLRQFRAAGGTVAAGTDASNQLLIPGLTQHLEMELLVRAGFTPHEALLAATRNGARLLQADSIGQIAPGKVADLVVLGADPLADIRNTRQVDRVVVRGILLAADSIRAGIGRQGLGVRGLPSPTPNP